MPADSTPAERSLRARAAAHARWARCPNRTEATAAARAARDSRIEDRVDPDGVMSPQDRARAVENYRRAHMTRMALRSAQARRRRRDGGAA
ncbi:hypothetical protein [Pseudonocardia xishanensis]|uniref:Uncharacterized protein n=1 Tax=Pseudonocardia xishanensis TaxID=630995 RepID=A0ABP8RRS9_9PSEU